MLSKRVFLRRISKIDYPWLVRNSRKSRGYISYGYLALEFGDTVRLEDEEAEDTFCL